jgi:hypothetical protein
MNMTGLADLPAEFIDGRGIRKPLPPEGFDDFRLQLLVSASVGKLISEIEHAYLTSEEIRTLYRTFDMTEEHNRPVQRALRLEIASSRKYTRFRFPNCPQLKASIHWILTRHLCETVGRDHLLDMHCTITVPCLGRVNNTMEWREHETPHKQSGDPAAGNVSRHAEPR